MKYLPRGRADGTFRNGSYGVVLGTPPPPPPPPPPGVGEPVDLHTFDIFPYCRLPGNHKYIIPDGVYTPGIYNPSIPINSNNNLTDADHSIPGGIFNGYTILEATTQGGVTMDLSYPGKDIGGGQKANGDWALTGQYIGGTTNGLVLSGFKFINGTLNCGATNIHLWYPEFTFPSTVWNAEPGRHTVINGAAQSYHGGNGCLLQSRGAVNNRTFGAYFHDAGVPWWPRAETRTIYMVGVIFERTEDGGPSVDVVDNVHPDSVSMIQGNVWTLWLTDFDVRGGGTETGVAIYDFAYGSSANITIARGWIHDCYGAGMNIVSIKSPYTLQSGAPGGGAYIHGTLDDVHIWGNGTGNSGQTSPNWQYLREMDNLGTVGTNINAGPTFDSDGNNRIDFPATNCNTLVPQSGLDFATKWKNANSFNSLLDYFDTLDWVR